ncbi:MAG: helix-turn-helix transcriptional regulator [Burkholderiales bacterium]|nr:helix-turn-helix transcriptional regulator [Phycisphaerae bacterium]
MRAITTPPDPRPRGQLTRTFVLALATNVADERSRVGLTQLGLAEAAELSRATVHLIEAGNCDPRLSTITSLAQALGVDPIQLLVPRSAIRDGI